MNIVCTTSFTFEGHRITEYKGLVRGIVVRAPTIAQGILGGLKKVIGGRIEAYRDMCEQVRGEALQTCSSTLSNLGPTQSSGCDMSPRRSWKVPRKYSATAPR